MLKDILVAAGGTVTVDTAEYRDLVERNAYLNVIMGFVNDPKTYILSDVCCIVDTLLNKPVVTDEETGDEDDNPEIIATLGATTERAESHA